MYYILQINDYRNKTNAHPKVRSFWITEDSIRFLVKDLDGANLGKRKRRRSRKFHKNREYIDNVRGNIFVKKSGEYLPPNESVSSVVEILDAIKLWTSVIFLWLNRTYNRKESHPRLSFSSLFLRFTYPFPG